MAGVRDLDCIGPNRSSQAVPADHADRRLMSGMGGPVSAFKKPGVRGRLSGAGGQAAAAFAFLLLTVAGAATGHAASCLDCHAVPPAAPTGVRPRFHTALTSWRYRLDCPGLRTVEAEIRLTENRIAELHSGLKGNVFGTNLRWKRDLSTLTAAHINLLAGEIGSAGEFSAREAAIRQALTRKVHRPLIEQAKRIRGLAGFGAAAAAAFVLAAALIRRRKKWSG